MRTAKRKYRLQIPNALKLRFDEIAENTENRLLDGFDRMASTRGKAITAFHRMTRNDANGLVYRSIIWNTASRIGQLEMKRACRAGKKWPKRITISDADKNALEMMNACKRYEFLQKTSKNDLIHLQSSA